MNKQNKRKKITITVGIPTYNEGANIAKLLNSILQQTTTHSEIKNIIIIDDLSDDNTVSEISKFKDPRIQVIVRSKRLGQTSAQNMIFEKAATDMVLLLEADTYLAENTYIDFMVQSILKNPLIGLVQGNMIPLPAKSYLGNILNTQFAIFTKFVTENDKFLTPITSGRGGRLFSQSVYTQLRWPKGVPDDDYAVLWCIHHKYPTFFQIKAHCYYQRPQILADHLKERQKIINAESTVKKHFSIETNKQHFQVPFITKMQMLLYFITHHFLQFCSYFLLLLIEKIIVKEGVFSDFWAQTRSTKKLH